MSRRRLPRSVLGEGEGEEEEEGRSMLSNKFLRERVQKGEVVTTAVLGVHLFMGILMHLEPGAGGRLPELLVPGPEARGRVPTANLPQTH